MRAEVIRTQPMNNNKGTATFYNLYNDNNQVAQYHCTSYITGDKHLSGHSAPRRDNIRAGTYNGVYEFNVDPRFLDEVKFMMKICNIPMQGGKKKSRRNRKSRLRTRKASHKKLTLRSSN